MTLNLAINNALSGLRTAQRSLDTVSHNIANAETAGFTRKTRQQEAVVIGGVGTGVRSSEVVRSVNATLQREAFRQNGLTLGLEVRENFLSKIELLSGRPEDETSLAASLADLRVSFEQLSATPESRTLQLNAINTAERLTRELNRMAQGVTQLRNDVQADLDAAIDSVNVELRKIHELNEAIVRDTQAGRSTAELEDKRDQALRTLSEWVDISYARVSDGRMVVLTRTGQTLVEKQPYPLSFTPSTLDDFSYYRASPPGNVAPITLATSPDSPDITNQLKGGKIGALLELRDVTMPTLTAQLDEFAHKLALRFRAAGMSIFSDDNTRVYTDPLSAPPPVGDGARIPPDVAGPAGYVGLAGRLRLSPETENPEFLRYGNAGVPATPPNLTVANSVIELVLDVAFGETQRDGTPHTPFRTRNVGPDVLANLESRLPQQASLQNFIEALITNQGQARSETTSLVAQARDLRESLDGRISNETGVNLDQELAQLTILQRTYGAAAQVLRTSQTLLDEILAINR